MEYELTSKDKQRIGSWKWQGINTTDWNYVAKRYNNATTCERCDEPFKYPHLVKKNLSTKVLDHNHNKIYDNIRGIICKSCNANLRHIDNGTMPDFKKDYVLKNKLKYPLFLSKK